MSGSICPKDLKSCPDDICRGAGCVQLNGEELLHVCQRCHAIQDYFCLFGCDDCETDEEIESRMNYEEDI